MESPPHLPDPVLDGDALDEGEVRVKLDLVLALPIDTARIEVAVPLGRKASAVYA